MNINSSHGGKGKNKIQVDLPKIIYLFKSKIPLNSNSLKDPLLLF